MGGAGNNLRTSVQPHCWCTRKANASGVLSTFHQAAPSLTGDETVHQIQVNAYMQFFLGYAGYSNKATFLLIYDGSFSHAVLR
jgi:hypothetical protein